MHAEHSEKQSTYALNKPQMRPPALASVLSSCIRSGGRLRGSGSLEAFSHTLHVSRAARFPACVCAANTTPPTGAGA